MKEILDKRYPQRNHTHANSWYFTFRNPLRELLLRIWVIVLRQEFRYDSVGYSGMGYIREVTYRSGKDIKSEKVYTTIPHKIFYDWYEQEKAFTNKQEILK